MAEQAGQAAAPALAARVRVWDVKWYRRINGWPGKMAPFLKHFTHVASSQTWGIILVIMYFVAWLGHIPFAWTFVKYAIANISSVFIIYAIKVKIKRVRPCYVLENVVVRTHPRHYRGPSFPSGHVQFWLSNTLVLSTILSQYVGTGIWPWMLPILLGMGVLVALSRVYVGVHYPTDVIAGFVSGPLIYLLTVFLTFPVWNLLYTWIDMLIH